MHIYEKKTFFSPINLQSARVIYARNFCVDIYGNFTLSTAAKYSKETEEEKKSFALCAAHSLCHIYIFAHHYHTMPRRYANATRLRLRLLCCTVLLALPPRQIYHQQRTQRMYFILHSLALFACAAVVHIRQ